MYCRIPVRTRPGVEEGPLLPSRADSTTMPTRVGAGDHQKRIVDSEET
jgi:hypothetical protein